ncbi:unnamed protein product [Gulo gulo]|uniref:Uncharacterized protein n=1 Tax=Gulo gulo TaxID=48420 RepID=A0A9X9MDD2_GULGU|nr:unnamed protein product [Gulo gulo]
MLKGDMTLLQGVST